MHVVRVRLFCRKSKLLKGSKVLGIANPNERSKKGGNFRNKKIKANMKI